MDELKGKRTYTFYWIIKNISKEFIRIENHLVIFRIL